MTETYRVDLPLAQKDRLKAKARELAVPVVTLVEQAVEMILGGEVKPITTPREVTLEDAGEIFLAHIEPAQAALIRDLCREHARQPYEYVLSYVYLAHERGETATMVGETVLERQAPASGTAFTDALVCEHCGKPLAASKRGQRFCPDPDDGTAGCGRQHELARLHAHRAQRAKGGDNRNAPTPQNLDVYRRAAGTVE